MAIKLNGSTSGSVALDAPADTSPSGTDVTLTLPTSAGSSGQYLQTDGSGTLSWQTVAIPDTWTDLGSTNFSGTSVTFTNSNLATATIIKIVFASMSTNSTTSANTELRLGNGSLGSTGYYWGLEDRQYSEGADNTNHIRFTGNNFGGNASYTYDGVITIMSTGNNMLVNHQVNTRGVGSWYPTHGVGIWTGGSTIDRFSIAAAAGSFDNGHFAVYYA